MGKEYKVYDSRDLVFNKSMACVMSENYVFENLILLERYCSRLWK